MPNTVHSYADRFKKVIRAASIHLDAQMQLVSMQQGNVIWGPRGAHVSNGGGAAKARASPLTNRIRCDGSCSRLHQ